MKRRALFAGLSVAVLPGCLSVFRTDTDGDGVVDDNDAAPADPRVSEYVSGDPPPTVGLDPLDESGGDDTLSVQVTHQGGDSFTEQNTGRLELAVEGTPIDTIELPFEVGDEQTIREVPLEQRVALIWFAPSDDSALVVTAREFEN